MKFEQLNLRQELLAAIQKKGYEEPTAIQKKAIPAILDGEDVLGGAQTGTGKTAAFALPMLELLSKRAGNSRLPSALILAPTRELAAQVEESFATYGANLSLRTTVIYGGVNMNRQVRELRDGTDIVVATPGRLLDHIQQRTINLSNIEILVLDEADRMLDMGFIRDIRKIIGYLPKKRQNLLFSATYSNEIKALAEKLLHNPVMVEVARRNTAAEIIEQKVHFIEKRQKRHLLAHLIKEQSWYQVLVFVRTKHGANRLAKQLDKSGIPALAIHGDKSQGARNRALAGFKSGDLQVLVATDVAARGIDLQELSHVVNFDLPQVPEDYIHRIGRTGRAGNSGTAISLVTDDEKPLLQKIERVMKRKVTVETVEDFVPVKIEQQPGQGQQGGSRSGGNGPNRGGPGRRSHVRDHNRSQRSGEGARGGSNRRSSQSRRSGSGSAGKSAGSNAGRSGNRSGR